VLCTGHLKVTLSTGSSQQEVKCGSSRHRESRFANALGVRWAFGECKERNHVLSVLYSNIFRIFNGNFIDKICADNEGTI